MKLKSLEHKIVDKILYLTKPQLKLQFPTIDSFPSVTQVLKDPKQEAVFRRLMKDPTSELAIATKRGTQAHKALETGVATDLLTEAVLTTFNSQIACDIDEVYGLEKPLAHPLGYTGKFDGLGIYQGKVTLFDYKKTNKRKTPSGLKTYYSQLMAYKQAHEYLYDLRIEQVAIFNIYGKLADEVNTNVTILTIDEMKHYLSVFNERLTPVTVQ